MTVDVLVVLFFALLTGAVLFGVLPMCGRYAALYGLHDLREGLYGVAIRNPEFRDSVVYIDMEFVLCMAIKIVREYPNRAVLGLFLTQVRPSWGPRPAQHWPKSEVDALLRLPASDVDVVLRMGRMVQFIGLAALLGNPLFLVVWSPLFACWRIYQLLVGTGGPIQGVEAMVATSRLIERGNGDDAVPSPT